MFKIESPYYLILLLLIPLGFALYPLLKSRSERVWSKLGNSKLLLQSFRTSERFKKVKLLLFLGAGIFLIIALANPQYGLKKQKVKSQNAEIIIALDISQSMLAEDIKPNRLERAKLWINQFTKKFQNSKLGLINFAGNAYLQSPVTTDIASINLLTSMSDPQLVSTQGTSLSAAIELSRKSFSSQEGQHKLLIIITDGEDHEGNAIEEAKKAFNNGITILCMPIGTDQGAPIPYKINSQIEYKRDKDGNIIYTKPNLKLLSDIANASGGLLLNLDSGELVFNQIQEKIKSVLKKETLFQAFNEYESYYQIPLFLAILCLFLYIYFHEKEKLNI
ncbi:MAG: VWA domain-containing protein [Saprospiraceae bacterium]|nr:VWA domain-containing protein [Saprospiraceae bacterium]